MKKFTKGLSLVGVQLSLAIAMMGYLVCAQAETSLLDYHSKALQHDASFLAARASFEAESKNEAIAASLFKPSVNISLGRESNSVQREDLLTNSSKSYSYAPANATLRLTQPLMDRARSATQDESRAKVQRAIHQFGAARLDLAVRLSQAYFNYLLAVDQQSLAQAQVGALQQQVRQLEGLIVSRTATRTELAEAQARLELARVQMRAAGIGLQTRRLEFAKITGEPPSSLLRPLQKSPKILPLEALPIEVWVARVTQNNPEILAQRAAVRLAEATVERARAGLYPRLSLDASSQHSKRGNYFTKYEQIHSIGINLSMNLYEGGSTVALSDQSSQQLQRARYELQTLEQDQGIKVDQLVAEISNAQVQIQAMEAAERSAQLALEGVRMGIQASVRTHADELAAVQQVYAVRRDLQRERYTYLASWLGLQALVGQQPEPALQVLQQHMLLP